LRQHNTLIITGRNGSGKSTLVKILSDVLKPDEGTVEIIAGDPGTKRQRSSYIGLVSPYLQMYDEFSASENLLLCMAMRGLRPDPVRVNEVLDEVSLGPRKNDPVRTYSSGMKQRLKYAFALVHRPPLLILDEPMSNLDAEGTGMVQRVIDRQLQKGIVIVATNNQSEIPSYDLQVDLNVAH
jgi:heme exporter protein A